MPQLIELKQQFQQLNNLVHTKIGKRDTLQRNLTLCENRLQDIDIETETITKAAVFLQTLSDTARKQILDKINTIVTDALQKVKDPNLEFRMNLVAERNQVDLDFSVFDKQLQLEQSIVDSCGGTIADLVTFALRLALLVKWNLTLSRILVLDESFKFVSAHDQHALGEFIRQLSEQLNLQIILVSHSSILSDKSHRTFKVSKTGVISQVEIQE